MSSSHESSQQAPVFGKICVSSGTAEDIDNLLFWESCEKSIFNFCLFVRGGVFFVCVLCVCLVAGCVFHFDKWFKRAPADELEPKKDPKANLSFHPLPLV